MPGGVKLLRTLINRHNRRKTKQELNQINHTLCHTNRNTAI